MVIINMCTQCSSCLMYPIYYDIRSKTSRERKHFWLCALNARLHEYKHLKTVCENCGQKDMKEYLKFYWERERTYNW